MPRKANSDDAGLPSDAIPLETLPMPGGVTKVHPPGYDMGDLTPPDDAPDEPPARPGIRIVTVEAPPAEPTESFTPQSQDSGGHDPTRPIGRGNPPRRGQQQAGQPSKNAKGRPSGTPNPDKLTRFMSKRIDATLPDGRRERMTRAEHLLWLVADGAARGNRHMHKLERELLEAEEMLDSLKLAHELKLARAGEQPKAPAKQVVERHFHDMYEQSFSVLRLLQRYKIVHLTGDEFVVAHWMRAAIEARQRPSPE